jgi:undecaprenyl-diphosphatase
MATQVVRTVGQVARFFRTLALRSLVWIGGHELGVLSAIGAVAGSAWLFGFIADEVLEGGTQAFDRSLLLAIRSAGARTPLLGPPAVQECARDVTALGGIPTLTLLTLIAAGFLFLSGKRRMAYFVCASVASGFLLSLILKGVFQRTRPDLVPHLVDVTHTSFPSGHSMMSSLTYFTLGALLARSQGLLRLKAYVLLLAVFLTFIVGVSRIYLGVHWPTDVLAGWTAGACWAALCWLVAWRLQGRRMLESEGDLKNNAPDRTLDN